MSIPRQLPNAITVVRILCAPVFLWMLLFGALLFHERVSPRQLLGCALLMAGVVLFALSEKEDEHES